MCTIIDIAGRVWWSIRDYMFQLIYSPTGVSQSTVGSIFVTTSQGQCYHKHLKMSGKHTDSKIDTSDHLKEEHTNANKYSCTAPNEV